MKRVITGIALAATGLIASATFATAANATEETKMFTNWFECQYYGQMWVANHTIISFTCYSNGNPMPGGPNAYMIAEV